MSARLPFLGLTFDPLSVNEAALAIADRARALRPLTYVATPNTDHVIRVQDQPGLRSLYDDAWLTLCDSRILELLAEASHLAIPAAPGLDLVRLLFETHIRRPERIVVIGGTQAMAEVLRRRYQLSDVRWFDAPAGLRGDAQARARCVDFICDNPAPFVLIAVGSPQQEMIARDAMARRGCIGVAVCCGDALDTLTGRQRRAPDWMQQRRLEWLHRLAMEPSRLWRRYLIEGPRIFSIWHDWRTQGLIPIQPANNIRLLPAPPASKSQGG